MNRRFRKLLTLWLLPLLVARAIVPVGFMFMAHSDGVRLMFCPGVMQSYDAMAADAHADHHDHAMHAAHMAAQDQTPHADAAGAGHNTPCPFSLVASFALLDVPHVAADSIFTSDETVAFTSAPAVSAGSAHLDRIRGPPRLS